MCKLQPFLCILQPLCANCNLFVQIETFLCKSQPFCAICNLSVQRATFMCKLLLFCANCNLSVQIAIFLCKSQPFWANCILYVHNAIFLWKLQSFCGNCTLYVQIVFFLSKFHINALLLMHSNYWPHAWSANNTVAAFLNCGHTCIYVYCSSGTNDSGFVDSYSLGSLFKLLSLFLHCI